MSRIGEMDNCYEFSNVIAKKLVSFWREKLFQLYRNRQIPLDELKYLVFTAYSVSMISRSKGAEFLQTTIEEFSDQWNEWVKDEPRMLTFFYKFQEEQVSNE